VGEYHANAFVDIQESGLGSFKFQTNNKLTEPLNFYDGNIEPVTIQYTGRIA
jgi:hypothetical protein